VVEFSNNSFTDVDQEDEDIRKALVSISKTVKVFDGGDGSVGAWQSVLADADVLVFPEVDGGRYFWKTTDTAVLPSAAKDYIKTWAESGKLIVGTGSYTHLQMITDLTGVDFTGLGNSSLGSPGDPWARLSSNTDLPATVPSANYTGAITNYSSLSSGQKAVMERIYFDSSTDTVAVANFSVGSGFYIYNAYDWYPSAADVSSGRRAEWDATLQFAASGAVTGQTFGATSTPEATGPLVPVLPRVDSLVIPLSSGEPELRMVGKRFHCVNEVVVGDQTVPFSRGFLTPQLEYLTANLSGLPAGSKTLELDTCLGTITYYDWIVIPEPIEPKAIWLKVGEWGLTESLKTKLADFNSNLGTGYSKVRCIVNSDNGEDLNMAFASQICRFVDSNDLSGSMTLTESKRSYQGSGYWINIWASGN
jgi:hypothetical protein